MHWYSMLKYHYLKVLPLKAALTVNSVLVGLPQPISVSHQLSPCTYYRQIFSAGSL